MLMDVFDIEKGKKGKSVPEGAGFRLEGRANFNISLSGTYRFYLGSDDGSRVHIDGEKIVNQWNG